jgi:uncharacterized protein
MGLWSLFVLVSVASVIFACYWGAGIILHPPAMSRLLIFPEQYSLPHERVSFATRDGLTLKGWWIPAPNPAERRTLIMCHGWGDNKGELLRETHFLNSEGGFNLLYFDTRSHGDSDGEITTIGYLETIDFDGAINYLRREKPEHVARLGVFGFSMGAAVAAMSMPDHAEIKAGVLESPFTEYRRVVRQWGWNRFRMPYFPLVMITLWMLRFRVGTSRVDTYSPAAFIGRIAPRPLFIIGGAEDSLMKESDVRRLFGLAGEPKTLWIVPAAAHGKCRSLAGLEYETRVINFFRRHL